MDGAVQHSISVLDEGNLTFMRIWWCRVSDFVHACLYQGMRLAWCDSPALQRSHQMSNSSSPAVGSGPPYLQPTSPMRAAYVRNRLPSATLGQNCRSA